MNDIMGCGEDFLFSTVRQTYRSAMKPPKTAASESLLCHNHLLLWMTVLLCNRNVCACLSSICGGICFILCSVSVCQHLASTHFKCYFYLNTKRGLARWPISVCKVCLVLSASFRWQIIFIKTAHKDDCQTHDRCVLAPIINDCPLKSHYCILLPQKEKKRGSTPSGSGGLAYKNHLS